MVLLLPVCIPVSPSTSSLLVGASAGAEGETEEWDPCLSPTSLRAMNCKAGPHSERGACSSASVLGRHLKQESLLHQHTSGWEGAAQRWVCVERNPLLQLLPSPRLASLPAGYRIGADIRCVSSDFPELSFGDTELGWQCQFAGSPLLAPGCFLPSRCAVRAPARALQDQSSGSVVCR